MAPHIYRTLISDSISGRAVVVAFYEGGKGAGALVALWQKRFSQFGRGAIFLTRVLQKHVDDIRRIFSGKV